MTGHKMNGRGLPLAVILALVLQTLGLVYYGSGKIYQIEANAATIKDNESRLVSLEQSEASGAIIGRIERQVIGIAARMAKVEHTGTRLEEQVKAVLRDLRRIDRTSAPIGGRNQ